MFKLLTRTGFDSFTEPAKHEHFGNYTLSGYEYKLLSTEIKLDWNRLINDKVLQVYIIPNFSL